MLQPHALANRLVTNAEYLALVREGGYREPGLWLSDGWATVQRESWQHPIYWQDDLLSEFTLGGVRELLRDGQVWLSVNEVAGGRMRLNNRADGYELEIESVTNEATP